MTKFGRTAMRAEHFLVISSSHFLLAMCGSVNLEKEAIVANGMLFSSPVGFRRNI